jgi:hypothetical protein
VISVNDSERRQFLEWIANKEMVSQAFHGIMRQQPARPFDGFIHASKLDWTKPYDKQFESHFKNFNPSTTAGYTRAGDALHNDIQSILTAFFGGSGGYPEYKFRIESIRFQGTIDRLQLQTPVGNILFEAKTTSTLHRDKTGGKQLLSKLKQHLRDQGFQREDKVRNLEERGEIPPGMTNEFHIFTDSWMNQVSERLMIRPRVIKPEENHLTQMFSYGWAMTNVVPIDWYCLLYIPRDTYSLKDFWENSTEFWYYAGAPETQQLINKAAVNFMGVQQCLIRHLQSSGYGGQQTA